MFKNFFASAPIWQTPGITLIRIILGLFMIYHGWEVFDSSKMREYAGWDNFKNSSFGLQMVYAGKAAELIAGILLFLGLFTRLAALLIVGTMAYITFFLGNGKIWSQDQHPFLLILLSMVFFFLGGGRWSMDRKLFKNRNRY